MAQTDNQQAGLGHIVVIALLVLVLAIIGFIGYKLYMHPSDGQSAIEPASSSPTASELTASDAPTVQSTSDLDKASGILDQVDTTSQSSNDSKQLDSQLSGLQ